jgi:hypothetical protein
MNAYRLLISVLVTGIAFAPASRVTGQQTTASPHGALPENLTCTSCHTTDDWAPLRSDLAFDHAATGFSLDGRHAAATCVRCHAGLVFDVDGDRAAAVGAGDCASCHLDVHQGSITRSCASCHSTASFADVDVGVAHPADFPLAGAHLQVSCESCHQNDLGGAFRALDTECSSCHMGDYFKAPVVDHQALGFSTFCTDCHSTTSFRDIPFDHFVMSGGFGLEGRHAAIDCTTCHNGPGGDVPTVARPDDCVACHVDDYDREHGGTGFPTDCVACHDPFGWEGASFEHSFPIFSGAHAGEWNDCADCHQTPSDYTSFSCLGCHRQAETDDEHQGERGYAYDSPTCLSCHPDGRH